MKRIIIIISLFICLVFMFLPVRADNKVKKIIIDPGHGGSDGGAEVNST